MTLRARIVGTGGYAPEEVVTNSELADRLARLGVETSDEWIRSRTGIERRHFARPDEQTSDMAREASLRALDMAGLKPKDLDLIVVGTISGDMPMPACAAFLQAKLGASCAAFDVSAACAGSIYGLSIADSFIRSGAARTVLVVGVELLSRILNWEDRNTCVLFGDAAGAMVLRAESSAEGRGVLTARIETDGALTDILKIPGGGSIYPMNEQSVADKLGYVAMNGREVFKTAVRSLSEVLKSTLASVDMTAEDLDWLVPHQANIRIVDTVIERLGMPREKAILNIAEYGNTSSASVPITLDEGVRSGQIQPGHVVGMMAIGSGMSWGASVVRW
ncbi:MAG: beta-ketoacyl-ACP synthase III [Myxococcota bacterium]